MDKTGERSLVVELTVIGWFITLLGAAFVGVLIGDEHGRTKIQTQAVETGHAVWKVDNKGNVAFEWKDGR